MSSPPNLMIYIYMTKQRLVSPKTTTVNEVNTDKIDQLATEQVGAVQARSDLPKQTQVPYAGKLQVPQGTPCSAGLACGNMYPAIVVRLRRSISARTPKDAEAQNQQRHRG